MVIDAILYNGERDIFDIRYNILKDVVDEFVVCEFNQTFSGKPKLAHSPINLPKVSHYYIHDWEQLKPDMSPAFQVEYSQREAIKGYLPSEGTIVFSDCDEIWSPGTPLVKMSKIRLRNYVYYLNNRSAEEFPWGPVVCDSKSIKEFGLNTLRKDVTLSPLFWGWHFTNMGGIDKLKYKIESYGHQEFNTPEVKDNLEKRIESNQDYIGRDFKMWIDESDWPPWLKEHREDYKHLLK